MTQKVAEVQQFVRRKVVELVSIDGAVEWEVLEEFVSFWHSFVDFSSFQCRHFDTATLAEVGEERALGRMCAYPCCDKASLQGPLKVQR